LALGNSKNTGSGILKRELPRNDRVRTKCRTGNRHFFPPLMTRKIICSAAKAKVGVRVKSTLRQIVTEGESGIIHYGTKFVPVG
jgi:hypothetical protein